MISIQRSTSAISLSYPREPDMTQSTDAFDAEISKMFGSLSLRAWAADTSVQSVQAQTPSQAQNLPPMPADDLMMMEVTDSSGNVQVRTNAPCYPEIQPYEPVPQFVESSHTAPQASNASESEHGCAMMHLLQAHYTPTEAQRACRPQAWDKDFNLLDTILTHRDAFLSCPAVHRQCSIMLTKIAFDIEKKHNAAMPYPSSEEEGDLDTAIALHNEAWLMSGWYST